MIWVASVFGCAIPQGTPSPDEVARRMEQAAQYRARGGDYTTAESLLQEALAIREKALPPDHPDLLKTLARYASLFRKTGREAEAVELEARAAAAKRVGADPASKDY